jgi:hypothetical protein
LTILDLAANIITNYEDLATLAITKRLLVLNLVGNPVSEKANYGETIRQLMPKV